jgi:septum formation topological specificity factor MinE
MQNRFMRIDEIHSRAISTEVAERLRLILANERSELPSSLTNLISRLPELDEDSPSIIPEQHRSKPNA